METATLPEYWNKFLLTQAETGMDYQIVAVTLRDGRVIEDVAIVGASIIGDPQKMGPSPCQQVNESRRHLTPMKGKIVASECGGWFCQFKSLLIEVES
jgi:hypothetical protein